MATASGFRRDLNQKREKTEAKGSAGTPLANVDPVAFQIYLKLSLMNAWSVKNLKALNLSPNTLLSFLSICRQFGISEAIKNLEAEADEFIRSFDDFRDINEFLEMSQANLAAVVSSEDLPMEEMDIFECSYRWAKFQCTQKGIEKTGENMRGVLGPVLFEIRFPRMSKNQFSEVCRLQSNLLSQLEQLAIRSLIGMDDEEREEYDESQLPFKTHARKQPKSECSRLCLKMNHKIVDSPSFVCDGKAKVNWFQICNRRIALHGIGFLGPIDEDSYFDVIVQIRRMINRSVAYDSGRKEKRIFARKRELFHFVFDEPITIEQCDDKSPFNNNDYYQVWFLLKGPNMMAVKRSYRAEEVIEKTDIKCRFCWWGVQPMLEFVYKKL